MSAAAEVVAKPGKKEEGLIQHQDLKYGKKLGQGGFGVVYQGTWRMVDIAIKELIPEKLTTESAEEFETEAQTMRRLRHPNIVQFYGYCISPKYCIVMEYMPNGSLFHLLHNKQTIQWDVRMRFAIDMARGLVYLHEENIVHRDIKSLNVLLDEHLKAKLTDFGLSKVKTETRSVSTKSSQSVGTIPWMAPELFSRRAVYTKKSDIYSLGMTFWELASCEIPFKDAASTELIPGWVKDGEREEIPLDCPQKLGSLIKACWEGVPDNRPDATTVAEFLLSQEINFADFLPSYQSRAKNQAAVSSGYQSNLSSAAAASPAKPAPSSSGYYNNQYSAVNQSPTVSPSPSPAMLVPDFQQKLQITKPAVPTVDIAEVRTFLKLVAEGKQDQAEALLKRTPALALHPFDVTDLSGRSFKSITGFQYAVWALDWYMWTMIRKYLPNDKAAEQVQSMKTGSWVSQHGVSASWQNLLDAQQKYIDLFNASKWSEAGTQWNKQVGGTQRLLPAHMVNEYCRPGRPFEPCPDFNSTVPLSRTRNTAEGEWYTANYNNGKLGDTFAYLRYSFDKTEPRAPGLAGGGFGRAAAADLKACHTLLSTRVQQRDQLFVEFSISLPSYQFGMNSSSSSSSSNGSLTQVVNSKELKTFLKLVADGEQDQAEAFLKKAPTLALYPSDVADLAGRSFKNITGFQYAVWALDWHMWTMIRKYLPNDKAREQVQGLEIGFWVSQHGACASWQNLLDALQKFINIRGSKFTLASNGDKCWHQEVGGAQQLLPAHVVNEYCRPDRSFEPCPDFSSTAPLPRTRNTIDGEWYTASPGTYVNPKLGDTFAYFRATDASAASGYGRGPTPPLACVAIVDRKACLTLLTTRMQQRNQLSAELLSGYQLSTAPESDNEPLMTVVARQKPNG